MAEVCVEQGVISRLEGMLALILGSRQRDVLRRLVCGSRGETWGHCCYISADAFIRAPNGNVKLFARRNMASGTSTFQRVCWNLLFYFPSNLCTYIKSASSRFFFCLSLSVISEYKFECKAAFDMYVPNLHFYMWIFLSGVVNPYYPSQLLYFNQISMKNC